MATPSSFLTSLAAICFCFKLFVNASTISSGALRIDPFKHTSLIFLASTSFTSLTPDEQAERTNEPNKSEESNSFSMGWYLK